MYQWRIAETGTGIFRDMTRADIAAVLEPMLAPWPEALQQLHLDACTRLAEMMHPADLLIYDNYNAVAPGWTYTGRTSDVAICLPIGTSGIRLGFYRGINLDDPEKRLLGEGNMFRSLKMTSLALLDDPYVQRLIADSIASAPRGDCAGRVIFKSESAKKRRPKW